MIRSAVFALLLFLCIDGQQSVSQPPGQRQFRLAGLTSSASVANSIFVNAPELPRLASVTYFLDDHPIASTQTFPFVLHDAGRNLGYSLDALHPGTHTLRAEAVLPNRPTLHSYVIMLDVVPPINHRFSRGLSAYANQLSAQSKALEAALKETSTPGAPLSLNDIATRRKVLAMYRNWGIDPAIDIGNDQSELLLSLNPHGEASSRETIATAPLSMLFSPDAAFYQPIPANWPRVLLPAGYIKQVQLNTNQEGDGIGFGQAVAGPQDHALTIRSQWYANTATLRTFTFRIPAHWPNSLPWEKAGDLHMIFVDPVAGTFVSSYKTSVDPMTGGANALYATSPTKLSSLGDRGGSIAAHFAELPAMLQPGEATDPSKPIRHALGGSVGRTWAARVYPANAWDSGIRKSRNSCTGKGFTNTGLVPYGGVIQLDPKLDLAKLKLTLPARRILEAIQTYGYYVEDFGCTDLDIYTAVSETEFDPFGGLWGDNHRGTGVQNEIEGVLIRNKLYVVTPLVKKE